MLRLNIPNMNKSQAYETAKDLAANLGEDVAVDGWGAQLNIGEIRSHIIVWKLKKEIDFTIQLLS